MRDDVEPVLKGYDTKINDFGNHLKEFLYTHKAHSDQQILQRWLDDIRQEGKKAKEAKNLIERKEQLLVDLQKLVDERA